MLLAGYDNHVLLPEKEFRDYERPEPSIPRSLGHHREWIHAIKTGGATTCNFDYAGPLAESLCLGVVACQFPGKRLKWDSKEMRVTNRAKANLLLEGKYRKF